MPKPFCFYSSFELFAQRRKLSFQALVTGRFATPGTRCRPWEAVAGDRNADAASARPSQERGWDELTPTSTPCGRRFASIGHIQGLPARGWTRGTHGRSGGRGRARGSAAGAGHALMITVRILPWLALARIQRETQRYAYRADTAL